MSDDLIEDSENNEISVPKYQDLSNQLQNALKMVDDVVLKNYSRNMHNYEIVPLDMSSEEKERDLASNVRLFKITEMTYEKNEYSMYKFASVFNTLASSNCAVFLILDSDGEKTDFYMGVRSYDANLTATFLEETLKNALTGQFPGIKIEDYCDVSKMESVLKKNISNISAVTCVANSKDSNNREDNSFVQGLEKLAFAMQGKRYTAIIIANSDTQQQLKDMREQYETIYSELAPFAKRQISYAQNQSVSVSTSQSKSSTDGTSDSVSKSNTEGTSSSTTDSSSHSESKENSGAKILSGLASVAGILGGAIGTIVGGPAGFIAGSAVGNFASSALGLAANTVRKTETDSTGESITNGTSHSETNSITQGKNHSETVGSTQTNGNMNGRGITNSITLENKNIIDTLERIDQQIKRLRDFESMGMWECASYFMSDEPYSAEIAASTYKALMRGENSGVEVCAINSWRNYEQNKVNLLKNYVCSLRQPVFNYPSMQGNIEVTPSALVSGNELALHMGLPRKSVCGFPVIEHVDFGKEVVSYSHENSADFIKLGKVFNMGSECANDVRLDHQSLSMHTFITGSTGSGKSNTVYEILRQLIIMGNHFLVIEPAKGEYKNVLGGRSDVSVYGTNPEFMQMLRINPFKFPNGIHVLEHVDRLIEIFNVCWPMYAAMPAVMKQAVLRAYEACGWDLHTSKNESGVENPYPTFKDLLRELSEVINESAYDEEVKSNYKGSLETRVRSLTDGLNGEIFSANEIDNHTLFDTNVIVDLSRVGSLETKSLIMGILVTRMNEYRMVSAGEMNVPLNHVTVLEEAHNILKRANGSDASPEGVSMAAKSVEMLSNAIAEMRTYGEGFIIADQSPSSVDMSAIRNTNTKIIMRLPDEADRRLAGKASGLRDDQLDEIAKLPKGVAVVYQNDWLEPVLCKVGRFKGEQKPYIKKEHDDIISEKDSRTFLSETVKLLLKDRCNDNPDVNVEIIKHFLPDVSIATTDRIWITNQVEEYLKTGKLTAWEKDNYGSLALRVSKFFCEEGELNRFMQQAQNFDELNKHLNYVIRSKTVDLPISMVVEISQCLMREACVVEPIGSDELYLAWQKFLMKEESVI